MIPIMMQLGDFQFGLETAAYQELQRSTAYTWAAQARFGQDDTLQFTGNGADTITLPGVIYPEFRGGIGQLDAMRALAGQGVLQMLIDGRGNMLGEWAIESIDETGTNFAAAGVALKQEFNIKLRRGPEEVGQGLIESALGVVASVGAMPITSNLTASAATLSASTTNTAGTMLSGLTGSLATVTGYAAQMGTQASLVLGAVRGGVNAARALQNGGIDAARLLSGVKSLAGLPSVMNGLVNVGGNVSRAAGASSSALSLAGLNLGTAGADIGAVGAVRDSMVAINQLNVLAVSVRATALDISGRAGG